MASTAKWHMKTRAQVEDVAMLVKDAKDDPGAFARLYDIYVQPVYRYLYSRVGTMHDAEDLTSQTFLAALEHLPRYRERGHFAAWLFRIARSKVLDHFRRNRFELSLEDAETAVSGGDALVQVIQGEEINRLRSLIRNLNA